MLSLFSPLRVYGIAPPPVVPTIDKFHPGIYPYVELRTFYDSAKMEVVYNELAADPNKRGLKIPIHWGVFESAANTWDLSAIDAVIARLNNIAEMGQQKYLMFHIIIREFQPIGYDADYTGNPAGLYWGTTRLLPADLAGANPLASGWPFSNAFGNEVAGELAKLNIKLNKTVVQDRFLAFIQHLANTYDNNETVIAMQLSESAASDVMPGDTLTGGIRSHYDALRDTYLSMKPMWTKTPVVANVNFDSTFVADFMLNYLVPNHFGVTSPNFNWNATINRTGIGVDTPKGILSYIDDIISTGTLIMASWEGDDQDEINPNTGNVPTPDELFTKTMTRSPHMLTVQRKGITTPMYWPTYSPWIAARSSITGGLITAKPALFL